VPRDSNSTSFRSNWSTDHRFQESATAELRTQLALKAGSNAHAIARRLPAGFFTHRVRSFGDRAGKGRHGHVGAVQSGTRDLRRAGAGRLDQRGEMMITGMLRVVRAW
jgi:hypothetical protein